MTANVRRRRRAAVIAVVVALLGLAGAAGLSYAGARAIATSTIGNNVTVEAAQRPRLPFGPTALLAVVDDGGRLTSVVVLAVNPSGNGGAIVPLAATANAGGDEGQPLNAVFAAGGITELLSAVESITGISYDFAEAVTPTDFLSLIEPLGQITVELPEAVVDRSSGAKFAAGELLLDMREAVDLLTASDEQVADWAYEPARQAVWEAIGVRLGNGFGEVAPVEIDEPWPVPESVDELVGRLFSAPVAVRPFSFTVVEEPTIAAELVDVVEGEAALVQHDPSEVIMVMSAAAPARLGAPLDGPTLRIVAPAPAEIVAAPGQVEAVGALVGELRERQVNVVSVSFVEAPTPELTTVKVVGERWTSVAAELFTDVQIEVNPGIVDGIPIEVTLGGDYYEEFDDKEFDDDQQ